MGRYRLSRLPALALAIGIPIGGAMLLLLLGEVPIRRDVGLLAVVAAVLFVAWLGGIWPALLSTLLLTLLLAFPLSLWFDPPTDAWSVFLFAVAAMVGTGIVESLYRTRWRAEAARDRARLSRRAEHALRAELQSIVGAIGDGILVADADGSVSLMNRAALEVTGGRTATVSTFVDLFVRGGNGAAGNVADLFDPDGSTTGEFQLAAVDRRIEISAFPLETEGEPARRVLVLRDVTEARRRDLLRDAFLSLLSHELRTPMTAVYGGATLLQRVGDTLDPATRNEIRADIVAEAERLSRLIDDLLVLTRVEGGMEVGQEPALLQHLVAEIIERDRRGYGRTRIELVTEPGLAPVKGDDTSIRQVLHNLISNAVKYSPPESVVEVTVESGPDEVQVRVLDRGPGVSADEATHVFEPFFRAQGTERLATGIGIGLFVSQRLVEAMGGRIWTRPRDGGGTEFGFALPNWPMDDPDEPMDEPIDDSEHADGQEPASAARTGAQTPA